MRPGFEQKLRNWLLIRRDLTGTAAPIPCLLHENESRSIAMKTIERLRKRALSVSTRSQTTISHPSTQRDGLQGNVCATAVILAYAANPQIFLLLPQWPGPQLALLVENETAAGLAEAVFSRFGAGAPDFGSLRPDSGSVPEHNGQHRQGRMAFLLES